LEHRYSELRREPDEFLRCGSLVKGDQVLHFSLGEVFVVNFESNFLGEFAKADTLRKQEARK